MRVIGCALVAFTCVGVASAAAASRPASVFHAPPALLITHSYSTNWSGYASYGGGSAFSDVKGTWSQPTADCTVTNKSTYSSFWVGIDGYNTSSVEQIGTEADCSHGRASYYAWYEMYPNPSVRISLAVTPRTSYAGEVKYNGNGTFTLTLSGGGGSFTTTQALSNPSLGSAEWIAEAPSLCAGGCHVAPLTDFGTVSFSSANANSKAISSTSWSNDPLTMVTNGFQVKAQPSGLSSNGTAFTDTWAHS